MSYFFFSRRRRHTSCLSDWSSDVCSSDLLAAKGTVSVPFTSTVAPDYLDTRFAGDILVRGEYDFALDGASRVGTTKTTESGRASCRGNQRDREGAARRRNTVSHQRSHEPR